MLRRPSLEYVFVMIRGFLGSLTTKPARRFLRESMSLYGFLQRRGLRMPAVTTILENVNLVSHRTRELIFDKQIGFILQEQWDDFGKLTIDSTSVKANSCWPTDGKIPTGLLMRANRLGQKLHIFGLEDFRNEAIEKDPDAHAREKKKLRLEDRRFFEGRTAELPEPDIEEENILAAELNLAVGRPRMPAYAVYVFVMIRLRMPAVTTILENVNLVSHRTRELIFDKQIGFILQEQWDDFGKLTIDGTCETEVEGQAEETLPAVAQAGPQGGRLTNGGTEPS